ncbi:MAG: UbiA family prenyltransferase [Anaerolineales bacterium]
MAPNLFRLSRPLHLLLAALTYLLGASIPAYLGKPFNVLTFWLGLGGVLFAQLGMNLLAEAFRPHNEPLIENETPLQKETLRNNLLFVSYASLAAVGTIVIVLYLSKNLVTSTFLFFLSSFILVIFYATPPFRLLDRGFGELALAIHVAYIIPSISFLLQSNATHRLLVVAVIPLTALGLAYFLILNFPTFSNDEKYQRSTLLRRLSWEVAVPLHHSLIAFVYIFFALVPLFGFSLSLVWRAFLPLPFAVFQVFQLTSIANGSPPNWRLLTFTALAGFGLTIYFLTVTFWIS